MKINFIKTYITLLILFVISNGSVFGQKVGAIDEDLSYYIDADSNLYVMSKSYNYYDLSESRYRQMDKPVKVPIAEKVLKIACVRNSSSNIYILGASGNIWSIQYDAYSQIDYSKIQPTLLDGSGTNIDIFDGGIVLKKDQNYYVMDNLSREEIIINGLITTGLDLNLIQKSKIKLAVRDWLGQMQVFDVRPSPSYLSTGMLESAFNSGFSSLAQSYIPGVSTNLEAQKTKLKNFITERYLLNNKPISQNFIDSVCRIYFESNPQIYGIPFTELGLNSSDLLKDGVSLKTYEFNDLAAAIRADSTLDIINVKRSYRMLESITHQRISSDIKWQTLAEGTRRLIAVAFDGTLVQFDTNSPNKVLFKPSDKSPDNKPYWKQFNSDYKSGFLNYGVKYDGSLWYMGRSDLDIIKHLKFSSDTVLYKIDKGTGWSNLTLTEYSAIGLKTDGKMYGWGSNNPSNYNILQDLNLSATYSVVGIVKDVSFKDFSFNNEHVLALSDNNELHYWGSGESNALSRTVFKKKNTIPYSIIATFQDKTVNLTYPKNNLFKETYLEPSSNYLLGSRGFSEVKSNLDNSTFKAKIRFNDMDTVQIKTIFKNQELIQGKKLETFRFSNGGNNVSYYYGELAAGVVNYKDNWDISRERTELIPNGYGILISQGCIYEGSFKNGVLSGTGIVNIGDEYDKVYQVSYIGEFKGGNLNGFAKKVWPDGSYYEGQWNENVLINGTASFAGEFTYSGEMSYRGEILTNKSEKYEKRALLNLDGKGKLYTAKGDTLIGDFRNGQINGKGLYLSSNYTYEGDLKQGLFSGYGIQKYRNGSNFTGEWVNGRKEGIFSETTSEGITKKSIWSDDKILIDENSPNFKLISSLSKTMLKLYLIDQGKFLSSLTNGYIFGGKSATSGGTNAAITGTLNVNTSGISICDVKAIAGMDSYNTINCVDLVSFQRTNGNVYLEFSGYISKKKRGYSIQSKINSQGKIERNITEGESSYERKTLNLTVKVNSYGQVNGFSMCFLDDEGNPDCGMGGYSGTLSKK
jgi:hypothetical protein